MNLDLSIALLLYMLFIAITLYYFSNLSMENIKWMKSLEVKKVVTSLVSEIFSFSNLEGKEVEFPYPLSLSIKYPSLLFSVFDVSGHNRVNEPVLISLDLDEECLNRVRKGTIRIYDEDFNEIPFRFVKEEFCKENYLRKATLFFETNTSRFSSRKFRLIFSNISSLELKNYENVSDILLLLTFDDYENIGYDFSGNNNHGKIYGNPTLTEGKFGMGLSLDEDYISIESNLTLLLDTELTISLWIKPNNPLGEKQTIIANSPSIGEYNYWIYLENSSLKVSVFSTEESNLVIPEVFNDTEWYYIVVRVKNKTIEVFINGEKVGEGESGENKWREGYTYIGSLGEERGTWFNGTVDEVRIYRRALSNEEIISHFYNPLEVCIFPVEEIDVISFEKILLLKDFSYNVLKELRFTNYNFRVEIYEK